jgi:hypothetical protein
MTLTQTAELPPLDSLHVDTHITIHNQGDEYWAVVLAHNDVEEIPIHLTKHDVQNLNRDLQGAIQRVASDFGKDEAYERSLLELARIGYYAFQRVFSDKEAREIIHDALQDGTVVQIVSKDFFVPWELLYDGPITTPIHASNFWGMRYMLSRLIIQGKRRGAFASSVIESSPPSIGLIAYDKLPFVAQQEIPTLKKLHKGKQIQLTSLRGLVINNRDAELIYLNRFFNKKLQVLHFACHAYEKDPIEQSFLKISNEFSLSMIDLVVGNFELKHHPFIILNACLTGQINPLYTSSWARHLWERGARGVLATDFLVPDWFGAAFSDALYIHLLEGEPIGQALLLIRRQLWDENEQRNPLGLAYALYAPPSIKIVK